VTNATLPEADYISVAEVAARLGLSKMTIYRMCDRGELASVRVGRMYRINRAAYFERYGVDAPATQPPAPAVIPGQTVINA
jgi:excisionase family DNA binding protein